MSARRLLPLSATLLAAAIGLPALPGADGVPVEKVVLYSSGVGYFEHAGKVAGNASTELRFKTAQINDILKSLVVQDLDGGKVGTIAYPSQDPITKTLASFQVNISGNPSLGDLLNQLRGARVTVTVANEKISGVVLGVEKQKKVVGDPQTTIEVWVLNLIAGATVRAVALDDVRQLDLEDAELKAELDKALAALSQARDQDKKPVVVSFVGNGERRVRLGYVVEAPVWKTSYRLVLPADPAAKPQMQGWAIVENQTDNDWNGINLTLVSGRPISFVQDLYQPLYIPRPVVEPELYASLRPQTYGGAMSGKKEADEFTRKPQLQARGRAAAKMAMPSAAPMEADMAMAAGAMEVEEGREMNAMLDPSSSVGSAANAEKLGEFFQYTVTGISLPRQRSAMIPIITDAIEAERVSIYNRSVLAKHPLLGAKLTNSTGKHLLQGPITVLADGGYAGDARIDDLPPGQHRLLSFAIDLQVLVQGENETNEESLLSGRLIDGVLELKRKRIATQVYVLDNKADKDRSVIIEHPLKSGWKLVDSPKPEEQTDALYRFRGDVKAGAASKLVIKEEVVLLETVAVVDMDVPTIEFYARSGAIPQPVRDALLKAAALKRAFDETGRAINEREQKVGAVTQEQNRIRENMRTVDQKSQYYQRLLAKLNEQETLLEKLNAEIDQLRVQREQQLKELHSFLAGVKLE